MTLVMGKLTLKKVEQDFVCDKAGRYRPVFPAVSGEVPVVTEQKVMTGCEQHRVFRDPGILH